MEILIVGLGTIITSYIFDVALGLQMYKDAADEGYKIDMKRYSEFVKSNENSTGSNINKLLIVPFVNIIVCFYKLAKYNEARPYLIDQLRVMDCLEPFTKEEEESYKAKPTGLNAMIVTIKSEVLRDTSEIKFSFSDGQGNKTIKTFKSSDELLAYLKDPKQHAAIEKSIEKDDSIQKTSKEVEPQNNSDKIQKIRNKKQALQNERDRVTNLSNQGQVKRTLKNKSKNQQ